MIEELNAHYDKFKEVLDVLPTNTKGNIEKKAAYIDEEYRNTNLYIDFVRRTIESRISKFSALKENDLSERIKVEIEKCNVANEWNTYNTSYEKMHLDCYLYQLSRYYKEDLLSVNNCIRKIIESFNRVGISITKDEFDFNSDAASYIEKIINNTSDEELQNYFEELYWKNSDIVKTIEINFKSIYLKNEKKIDKYYENRHQEYLKNHTDEELYNARIVLAKQLDDAIEKDPYLNFQKFVNNEYLLANYKKDEIDKKINTYFENNSYTVDGLLELYDVLNEYNVLIKYKYLFDDMKEKLQTKDTFKNSKATALKAIEKDEGALKKLNASHNKKSLFGKGKKNDEKWLFKYKEVLNNVIKGYDEFDTAAFNDLIFSVLKEDSTILEVLKLITSNYLYFVSKTKELDDTKTLEDITESFESLRDYVSSKNFILLNNIALLDEKQMKELIVNKYNLEHITLTVESLLPDDIDKTLENIKTIINYENIIASGINMDDITLYLDYKKME